MNNNQQHTRYKRASKNIPPVGIYHALYNGDHVIFQVHDGGFRVINYHGERDDAPKLNLVKWIDEAALSQPVAPQGEEAKPTIYDRDKAAAYAYKFGIAEDIKEFAIKDFLAGMMAERSAAPVADNSDVEGFIEKVVHELYENGLPTNSALVADFMRQHFPAASVENRYMEEQLKQAIRLLNELRFAGNILDSQRVAIIEILATLTPKQ